MNSAKKPIIPLETAVMLKMETEMIANIIPNNFSIIFYCIIDTLERIKKGIAIAKVPKDGVGATIEVRGRDLVNGVPKEIEINQAQICEALA